MTSKAVLYEKKQNVGIITLNRPDRLNAINKDLLQGLIKDLRAAAQDQEVVSVILTGAGRAFSAGIDLKELGSGDLDILKGEDGVLGVKMIRTMEAFDRPIIGAINGPAVTGGFELALTRSGTKLIKYWLDIEDDTQEARFQQRIDDPRRRWKLSPMDLEARSRWVDYSRARDNMLFQTSTPHAPWYVVDSNIKRHARLNIISHLLSLIPYEDLTPEPLELPARQDAGAYRHPDFSALNSVPAVYP